ncbi:MAG TPA: hypothetical protein VK896_03845, partial [Gaiellaceae bacterium]|nr:hypothetical protein [Gaiellaceae bacterium]
SKRHEEVNTSQGGRARAGGRASYWINDRLTPSELIRHGFAPRAALAQASRPPRTGVNARNPARGRRVCDTLPS